MKLFKVFILFIFLFQLYGCGNTADQTPSKEDTTTQKYLLTKPNILILHVDDLGYHDLSINGSKIYQTPNIDGLAKESVVFNNAYSNYPRCVPSRYAMLTGSYPIKDGDVPDDGFKMNDIKDTQNLIKHIGASGYQSSYFGKWHLGDGASSPVGFGFDKSVAAGAAGSPISYHYPFNVKKGKGESNKDPIEDLDEISKQDDYLTDVLTDQVIDYINNRDKEKPFLAMLAFYAVHQPIEAKAEDTQRNEAEIKAFDYGNQPEYIDEGTGRTKMRQDNAEYAAMVEIMDVNVGKLIQVIKTLGLYENTIIIFSSDHGGLSNDGTNQRNLATSNYPLRAGKGWLYEGGIKVPLYFKWNKFQPREENSIVMLMDIFPTVLDIASNKKLNVDGKSLLPILEKKESWDERTVFWHSSKARPRNTGDTKSSAIRQGDFKLINWYEEGRTELYNIEDDPYETKNITENDPELTVNLLNELKAWKSNF